MVHTTILASMIGLLLAGTVQAQGVELVGASQFNEGHAATKTMREFERLVTECYSGEVIFELHKDAELGLDRDYFEGMSQGRIDYASVSPWSLSGSSQLASLLNMPFLFGSKAHLDAVINTGTLDPIANEILENSNVRIIGYAGGGTRNIFANRPVTNVEDLSGLSLRMQAAPVWAEVFSALGAVPTVIPYNEVYIALQTGAIDAADIATAGVEQTKFYEVGPEVALTQHGITVRPLAFANSTYERLDPELQTCIDMAGVAAGQFGREIESRQDAETLAELEADGLLTPHAFEDRAKLFELAEPLLLKYAEDLGAAEIYDNITLTCPDWCDGSCNHHDCDACRNC